MNVWIAVVAAGIATFALRISLMAVFARVTVPRRVEQVLRLAAPASVAALTALALVGATAPAAGAAAALVPWVALAIAVFVSYHTRSVAITVAAGLAVFSVLTAVVA